MSNLFITDATIFTGTGPVIERGHVAVEDRRVVAVGPEAVPPSDAVTLDAGGCFVMAGFIDMHTHLGLPDVPERPEPHPDVPFLAARAARTVLSSGVTTVRDVGGNNHADLALKRAIQRGDTPGPRMFACGQAVVPTGGHIHCFCMEADGVDDTRKAVRTQVKAGADWIKLMISGGIAAVEERPDEVSYEPEEIASAVRTAEARGRKVAVHAYPSRAMRIACEAGVATIEHAVHLDEAAIAAVKAHDVAIVPTHAVYEYMAGNKSGRFPHLAPIAKRVFEHKDQPLRDAIAAGLRIGVGTDCGRHYPFDGIARELELLSEAGMGNEAVLVAVTKGNAGLLGADNSIGTLEPGKRADLVILEGNALDDLSACRQVRTVVLDGHAIDPAALRQSVKID